MKSSPRKKLNFPFEVIIGAFLISTKEKNTKSKN